MQVLLDTNALMLPAQFRVDIFSQLAGAEFIVLDASLRELKKLAAGRGKTAAAAKLALQLIVAKPVRIVKSARSGDDAILAYATAHRCTVATNDKELIKALQSQGIVVVRMMDKRYLSEG